jgi:hypothetical protein
MVESLLEEIPHMAVVQRVIDNPAILPVFDHPQGAEQSQLVGDSRLGGTQEAGNVANTEFFERKSLKDADSGGITEHPESFGKPE